jgi:hypothetical protein
MLDPNSDSIKGVEFDFVLSDHDRAVLVSAVRQEWFDILQRLMEQEIRLMNIRLLNTPNSDHAALIGNHATAQAAAAFYKGLMQRLATALEIEVFNSNTVGTMENPEVPPYSEEMS